MRVCVRDVCVFCFVCHGTPPTDRGSAQRSVSFLQTVTTLQGATGGLLGPFLPGKPVRTKLWSRAYAGSKKLASRVWDEFGGMNSLHLVVGENIVGSLSVIVRKTSAHVEARAMIVTETATRAVHPHFVTLDFIEK